MIRLLITITILNITTLLSAQDRPVGEPFATRSEVLAKHGMAATSQPLATQVALDILKEGGSAVDAAIAANAVLGVVKPEGNGIGGDLFAIVWDADSEDLHGLNASGRSPKGLSLEWFRENGYERIPSRGPLTVSVPGAVDGWSELHERFGKLSMEEILAPAIQYAREGFPVTEEVAHSWRGKAESVKDFPNFADVYLPGGEPPAKGDIFRNPRLASSLERITDGGRDAFYEGKMARTLAEHVQEQGGFLSVEDLAAHESEWVQPMSTDYRGYTVWEMPPSSQGIAVLQMLNILEGYDIAAMGLGSAEYIHTFVEAKKLAFEDMARYYADPDFASVPVPRLISKEYADERRKLIDPEKEAKNVSAGDLEGGDTIYLAVADDDGNMVSLIQSNFNGFGSGMVPPGLGFGLQNRGKQFNLDPEHPNRFEPGKRPFHTIIPAFVTRDGEPWLSFGVKGGFMQPQGHVQILVNLIDFGMNLQEAGDAPRIRHMGSSDPTGRSQLPFGGFVYLESGFPHETHRTLSRMDHDVGFRSGIYGGYQAILKDPESGVYYGASESRMDGQAAGY